MATEKRTFRIVECGHPAPDKPAPLPAGIVQRTKLLATGKTVTHVVSMAQRRTVPSIVGELIIVDEGSGVGSVLDLSAPPRRDKYEPGADGVRLSIVNTCDLTQTIKTPPACLNGKHDTIEIRGYGGCELYAFGGRWIVLHASHSVSFK